MGDIQERTRKEKLITALVLLEERKRRQIILFPDSKDTDFLSVPCQKETKIFIPPTDA